MPRLVHGVNYYGQRRLAASEYRTIASVFLGLIERLVGTLQHSIERIVVRGLRRDADADRKPHYCIVIGMGCFGCLYLLS